MSIDLPNPRATAESCRTALATLMELIGDDPSLAHIKGIEMAVSKIMKPVRKILQNKEINLTLAPYNACEVDLVAAETKLWSLARKAQRVSSLDDSED